jgi:hypothetical protein
MQRLEERNAEFREETADTRSLSLLSNATDNGSEPFPLPFPTKDLFSPKFLGDLFPTFLGFLSDSAIRSLQHQPQFVELGNRRFFIEDPQRWYVPIPEYNLV